jgi:hypothetical protein
MTMRKKLSRSMTVEQFDNGYWYATELKAFATTIGIPGANKLRKDELERAITHYLDTGTIQPSRPRHVARSDIRDVERGLARKLRVVRYTNDPETKGFLEREALRRAPGMKRKSGARYRLNRWREEQLASGVDLTYGDLIDEYVRLNQSRVPFAKIPHGRYINFVSDYFRARKGATMDDVIAAWAELKTLDMPKTFQAWSKFASRARIAPVKPRR